jgi:activator of HSP90 ATPase
MRGGCPVGRTIVQTVKFKASPKLLFSLYTDSRKHSAVTGHRAAISTRIGAACSAFNGSLNGKTLGVIRDRLFVQTWRNDSWKPARADSVLCLFFEKDGKGGKVTMVHANIPDEHYPGIRKGWTTYYWAPWKRYIAAAGKRRKTRR